MKFIIACLTVVILGFASGSAYSQVDRGGTPRSFQDQSVLKSQPRQLEITPPDVLSLQKEDMEDARLEKSYRVGVEVPVTISSAKDGQWESLPTGGSLWRLSLGCKGAQGIGLNYNDLRLPVGSDLYVYTANHRSVIGAFSKAEVPYDHRFTTRPLHGDEVILEVYNPGNSDEQAVIEISGIVYMYRGFGLQETKQSSSVTSGLCEVNVNCEEGQNWQNQKRGVVKILTKVGAKYFYCTGALMNNTTQDFSSLLLTASHCSKDQNGGLASETDLDQWIFYFDYESTGCLSTAAQELTVVGAQKLATSENPTDIGSDFLLLKFINSIPALYYPYYCGWDAGTGISSSGVCIHHPDGDIKKISTYTSALGSDSWGGSTPGTHWVVQWTATSNGFGVTEGGSSGSPLFDDEGLVIGSLTGGESSCTKTEGKDMYGKVPFSWVSNGPLAEQQLKPWLDPGNTGILKMPGSFNDKQAIADFSADSRTIQVGTSVDFHDLSSGKPISWHWYFQAGKPAESAEQNPTGVRFDQSGEKNVKLVVTNAFNSDTLTRIKYINVRAVVSPNPCTGVVNILADVNNSNKVTIEVFDMNGKIAQHFDYEGASSQGFSIVLPDYGNVFMVRLIQGYQVQTHKVIVVR